MITVVHCRDPHDFYIGRPGLLGNPYTHIQDRKTRAEFVVATLDEAIARWTDYAWQRMQIDKVFRDAILACDGKTVGCWCKPHHACHGDTFDGLIQRWRQQSLFLG